MSENSMTAASGQRSDLRRQLERVISLSIPAILAEISSMAMQYIDAAMVGSLGAKASASIGLVSTSTWLMGGLCISVATGFSVQAAHLIGAERQEEAKHVLRQAFSTAIVVGLLLCAVGVSISGWAAGLAGRGGEPAGGRQQLFLHLRLCAPGGSAASALREYAPVQRKYEDAQHPECGHVRAGCDF